MAHGHRRLGGHLLVGEPRDVCALAGVFDCNPANVAISVNVQKRVLVQVPGLGNLGFLKLDIQRVCILEILDFHGLDCMSLDAYLSAGRISTTMTLLTASSSQYVMA